jgi:hypothetical protein
MTAGYSGSYSFNNVDLTIPPSTGNWKERPNYGIDGGGHTIYSSVRDFEMKWDLISVANLATIIGIYNGVGNTGTAVSCLPEWGNANYLFKNYSGTVLQEPTVGEYFQEFVQDVTLLILNVRTN